MAKKILMLCSSPRKNGNTNMLAGWVAAAAEEAGAKVEVVDVTKLKLKSAGCTACMGCQKRAKFECVIRDEVSTLVKRIPGFDAVVFATPVYFFGPNAQLKVVLDRMFSHIKIDMKTGNYTHVKGYPVIGLLATAGGDLNEGLNICKMTFKTLAEFTGKKFETLLVPLAPGNPAELLKREDVRKKAIKLGRKLAGKQRA